MFKVYKRSSKISRITWRNVHVATITQLSSNEYDVWDRRTKGAESFMSYDLALSFALGKDYSWIGPRSDAMHHSVYERYQPKQTKKRWALT